MFICHVQCVFYACNIFWILKIYRRGGASMCCCGQNIPIIGKPCSHASSFLRPCYAIGVFFGCFLRLMTWGKRRFQTGARRTTPGFVRRAPVGYFVFLRLYTVVAHSSMSRFLRRGISRLLDCSGFSGSVWSMNCMKRRTHFPLRPNQYHMVTF